MSPLFIASLSSSILTGSRTWYDILSAPAKSLVIFASWIPGYHLLIPHGTWINACVFGRHCWSFWLHILLKHQVVVVPGRMPELHNKSSHGAAQHSVSICSFWRTPLGSDDNGHKAGRKGPQHETSGGLNSQLFSQHGARRKCYPIWCLSSMEQSMCGVEPFSSPEKPFDER